MRGETSRALAELNEAVSALPARGFTMWTGLPQHVPIWVSLARAYQAFGDDARAAEYYRRILESTGERLEWPIPFVRSLYLLGKIHEKRGEMDKAREYYRRFVEHWKNGDLDLERVIEAEQKLR